MRVLMLHAKYREPGGEEQSFLAEEAAFRALGARVLTLYAQNAETKRGASGAIAAIFNLRQFRRTLRAIREFRPDIIYVNNTWVGLSPAPLLAARLRRIPTLQALRNYRLVCPSAKLADDARCFVCGSFASLGCVLRGCAGGSRTLALLAWLHGLSSRAIVFGWADHRYVTPSNLSRDLLMRRGLQRRRISVRPNFLRDTPILTEPAPMRRQGVVFVGRLSAEKGIGELVTAWLSADDLPDLYVVGEGELHGDLSTRIGSSTRVRLCGAMPATQVRAVMARSVATIVSSSWAEPFGRVAIESMSVATPVIALRRGALPEVIGETGVLLNEVTPHELRAALRIVEAPQAQVEAAQRFVAEYTERVAVENLRLLVEDVTRSAR